MPVTRAAGAHEPKRQRGHLRVAAIMEAGVAVFTEKGYDAATMTEIAARSETAIGSLYRFFPSKEALADALLLRYAEHVTGKFEALAQRASSMPRDELADALVDFRLSLESQRGFAGALLDARGGSDVRRATFRQAASEGLGRVLRAAIPVLTKVKSETMAAVLLHVLKGLSAVDAEKPAARRLRQTEIRLLVHVYLRSAQESARAPR
jgi:AcrR family transcriptional regulator